METLQFYMSVKTFRYTVFVWESFNSYETKSNSVYNVFLCVWKARNWSGPFCLWVMPFVWHRDVWSSLISSLCVRRLLVTSFCGTRLRLTCFRVYFKYELSMFHWATLLANPFACSCENWSERHWQNLVLLSVLLSRRPCPSVHSLPCSRFISTDLVSLLESLLL